MANADYAQRGIIGPNFARRTTDAEFALGTTTVSQDNEAWIYVLAGEAVATGTCTVTTATNVLTDAAGNHTADVAFADAEYGWVHQTAKWTA